MLKMMVFVALTGLTFTHELANADEKVPHSGAIFPDSYRTSESDSLVLAQNSNSTKDAAPVQ